MWALKPRGETLIKSDRHPSPHHESRGWQPAPVSGSGALPLAPAELGQGDTGIQLLADG